MHFCLNYKQREKKILSLQDCIVNSDWGGDPRKANACIMRSPPVLLIRWYVDMADTFDEGTKSRFLFVGREICKRYQVSMKGTKNVERTFPQKRT